MKECVWTKATYGSGPTGIFMEIALREPLADAAVKPEVKELLADSHFVDDLGHSDDDHQRLIEHVQDYIKICSQFNFEDTVMFPLPTTYMRAQKPIKLGHYSA